MTHHADSRRDFLSTTMLTAPAATLGALGALGALSALSAANVAAQQPAAPPAEAPPPKPTARRVVPGSPSPAYSRAVAWDKLVYVAGVVGAHPESGDISRDFVVQCRQTLENLKASVEACGSSMDKVLKCTCFLTDVADFPAFNRLYQTYFPAPPPARSTVVVKELVVPGAVVEVDCVTFVDG